MIQIYLLSVVSCLFGGFLLLSGQSFEKFPALTVLRDWYGNNQAYQPFLFCLFALVGLLGMIFPYKGIFFLGDLLPALSCISIGLILFFRYYQERGQVISESFGKVMDFFEQYEGAFGAIACIAGLAHFFFPGVIFL